MLQNMLLLYLMINTFADACYYQQTGVGVIPENGTLRAVKCSFETCCDREHCNAVYEESGDLVCYYGSFGLSHIDSNENGWLKMKNATKCLAPTANLSLNLVATYKDLCSESCLQSDLITKYAVDFERKMYTTQIDFESSSLAKYGTQIDHIILWRDYVNRKVCALTWRCKTDTISVVVTLKSGRKVKTPNYQDFATCENSTWKYRRYEEDEITNVICQQL